MIGDYRGGAMKKEKQKIDEIIEIIGKSSLTEFILEEKDLKITIKKDATSNQGYISEEIEEEEEEAIELENNSNEIIKSEMVGRFHYKGKDGENLIELGKKVKKGDIIGYIKGIGLETPILSTVDGVIREICISDGEIAEYGKELIQISK